MSSHVGSGSPSTPPPPPGSGSPSTPPPLGSGSPSTPPPPPGSGSASTPPPGSGSSTQAEGARAKSVREWLAVAISAVALLCAGAGLVYTHNSAVEAKASLDQARKSYDQAAEQFERSGPQLKITDIYIQIWNQGKKNWTDRIEHGTVLTYEQLAPPNQPYIIFDVVNSGRSSVSIAEVGIGTAADTYEPASGASCPAPKEALQECRFPIELAPSRRQQIYLGLDRVSREKLTCNEYIAGSGLEAVVVATDNAQQTYAQSQVSLAYATYCPSIPSQGPR
jgi:hypothetical protein